MCDVCECVCAHVRAGSCQSTPDAGGVQLAFDNRCCLGTCVYAQAGSRPSTPGAGGVQLVSDELLNDHPLLLEYLAKHVLAAGLKEVQQVRRVRVT
eukprot:1158333-Pelagomonas_calceolata.AAC.4